MATVRRLITPTDWMNRQINTLKAVGEANYRIGIQNPKKDPIQAGIAAEQKYQNALRESFTDNRRSKHLAEVTMAEWAGYADTIGAPKLVDGVVRRQAKISKFLTAYVPQLQTIVDKLDQMPTGTASERNAKVIANLEALRALKGQL